MTDSAASVSVGLAPTNPAAAPATWLWIGPRTGSLSWPLELLRQAAGGEGYGLSNPTDLSRQSIESPHVVSERLWPCEEDRFEWQAIQRQRITRLIISSDNRSEPWPDWLTTAGRWFPQAEATVLLGSWWEGHRRTEPHLPDIPRWYWHQAFDRLGTWLEDASLDVRPSGCRWLVLVLSPSGRLSRDRASLWQDLLAAYDLQPLVLDDPSSLPVGSPLAVVVDHGQTSDSNAASLADCWSRLRQTYPDSWLISCRAFPRWDQWLADRQAGADRLLSQPFDAAGLTSSMLRLGVRQRTASPAQCGENHCGAAEPQLHG